LIERNERHLRNLRAPELESEGVLKGVMQEREP
jgi:hypothetical protein